MTLVIGNWKMHGTHHKIVAFLAQLSPAPAGITPVLCFPFPYLTLASQLLPHGYSLGAQDLSCYDQGAYTGQVSAAMLKDCGVHYVLIGHCEHRDARDTIEKKIDQAMRYGLEPIVCFEKKSQILQFSAPCTLAYEPAVGADSLPEDLSAQILDLLELCKKPLLYGGSVNTDTLKNLCPLPISGLLVGRASLEASSWCQLLETLAGAKRTPGHFFH